MNSRSGVLVVFLFLFLSVMILLQILSMVQSDRLFTRLNRLIDTWENAAPIGNVPASQRADKQYPGDVGDWLVWRFGAEPRTLNPISVEGDIYTTWITSGSIFESLLEYDLDQVKLVPLLAQSYQISQDGLKITFKLRDDIYFSDGEPVTADDVIFSFETITNPKIDAASLANYYINTKEVVKISQREVQFVNKEPYWKALAIAGGMPILPKHIYKFKDAEEFNKRQSDPVGSGSYIFEKWQVGREVVLRRNDRYWGKKPNIKKIVYRFITNDLAAIQALRAHEVDIMIPRAEQFVELSADPSFAKEFMCLEYWNPGVPYFFIGWNQDTVFFGDSKVRMAMTHMLNRDAIVKYLLKDKGHVVSGPFYFRGPQADPTIQPWPFDLQRAAELLDQAGWVDSDGDGIRDKDGIPFRFKFMIVSGNPFYDRVAKLFKDDAAKVGVEVIPDPYEWSIIMEKLSKRQFEAQMSGWGGAIEEDPYQIWHSSQIAGRGSNRIGFNNPQADALIEQARKVLDPTKRNALYHKFHQIVHEQQPYTFIYTRPTFRFLDRRFKNVIVHKLGLDEREWYVPKAKQRYK